MGGDAPASHGGLRPHLRRGFAPEIAGINGRREGEGIKGGRGADHFGNRGYDPHWESQQAILGAWSEHAWLLSQFIETHKFEFHRR